MIRFELDVASNTSQAPHSETNYQLFSQFYASACHERGRLLPSSGSHGSLYPGAALGQLIFDLCCSSNMQNIKCTNAVSIYQKCKMLR